MRALRARAPNLRAHRRSRSHQCARAAAPPPTSLSPPARATRASASAPLPTPSPAWKIATNQSFNVLALACASVGMTVVTLVAAATPALRAVERAARSADAAAIAAARAAVEIEDLSKIAKNEIPSALASVEASSREVEQLARETRAGLTRLDAFNVDALVNDFTTKMTSFNDPTREISRDFANLSDDASEYVRRLSMELGLVMQSVGALTSGEFDDAFDVVGLTAEEKSERKNAIADAVQVARETTERAKVLSAQLQNPSSGRDIAEVLGKIEQSTRDVSTAMFNALRVFETVGVVPQDAARREIARDRTRDGD